MDDRYRLLDHPSDIGLCALGDSREQALAAASRGLVSILVDPGAVAAVEERALRGIGADEPARIIHWLNEILFHFDAEGLILREFEVRSWTDEAITGVGRGERFDPERHALRTSVKAVTYHQFESGPVDGGWEIRVFVDL